MRPAWLRIDLDAYSHNLQQIRQHVGTELPLIAVVKANAYAHGAVPIANRAVEAGAHMLAVALLQEAVELRAAGILTPILVLGATDTSETDGFVEHDVIPTVANLSFAQALAEAAARQGKTALFHVKLDTGMGRQGVRPEEIAQFAQGIRALPHAKATGVFSHFANSAGDDEFTREQTQCFREGSETLRKELGSPPRGEGLLRHLANSGGVAFHPDTWFDAVRPGGICYGINRYDRPCPIVARQVMSLHARIVTTKTLEPGDSVGYDRAFVAQRKTRTAVLPLGYADGYPRSASGKGHVLVGGKRCPILGRVSMDCVVIDVTDVEGCEVGDEAVLLGAQGDEMISTAELAELAGSCVEETSARLSRRLRRVYG